MHSLFRLGQAQIKQAAEVLARAFQEDLLYTYVIPDADERKRILPHFFEFRVCYGILYGEVYAVSRNFEGVAVWIPSENAHMTQERIFRAGGFSLYLKAGSEVMSRLNSVGAYVSSTHRHHASFPHWHLSPMGVAPSFQGQGYGGAMLKAMLARLDREEVPCFLETQSERNVTFYQRYGFRVVEKGEIPGTEIPHWAMLREG